jgi:hypothetical protein
MEARDLNPSPDVERLERDVIRIQRNISTILSELDRRRQEFLDWRNRVSSHRAEVIVAGAAIAFFAAAALFRGKSQQRIDESWPDGRLFKE